MSVHKSFDKLADIDNDSLTAYALATHLPCCHDVPQSSLQSVWTDEWTSEGEEWGVSLNGTGTYRQWYGSLYHGPDQTVRVEHPAGTAVVGLDGQALVVLKPDSNEWFCERDDIDLWTRAVVCELHDRTRQLGHDVPAIEDVLEGGE